MRVATSLPWVVTGASVSKMAPDCKPSLIHRYLRSAWSKPDAGNSQAHCHRPSGAPPVLAPRSARGVTECESPNTDLTCADHHLACAP